METFQRPVVGILKKDPKARLPEYESSGAAGADIRANVPEPVVIPPLGRARIPTGLALEIPPGYEAQVRPRSGLAARGGITVLNSPGTIDSDYRGELEVILINLGSRSFTVADGDRIAQLIISPVCRALMRETGSLSGTERGDGGFGSTGV
jgi:dUTP pyrophosphatase